MVPMLKVLLDTALGIQKAIDKCLKPIVSKLSEGIKSLPYELLALIFTFAGRLDGRKQAVRLSHVSRRFRAVALGEPSLWTTMHSNARKDELETFMSRCGQETDPHIIFDITPRNFNKDELFGIMLAHRFPLEITHGFRESQVAL